jgi:hypothetical protein
MEWIGWWLVLMVDGVGGERSRKRTGKRQDKKKREERTQQHEPN